MEPEPDSDSLPPPEAPSEAAASPPPTPPEPAKTIPGSEAEAEACRLKSLAEEKLQFSSFKSALKYAKRAARLAPNLDGVAQMVSALKVLRADPSDHYDVLHLPPFSAPAAIRKQYKTLALALHPDKSASHPVPAAEDAFKRVAASFRFLSDRSLKRDFDMRLRLSLSAAATAEDEAVVPPTTFWTACTICRLLHEFDRKYVGYRLVCPSCRKSFLAIEVRSGGKPGAHANGENDDEDKVRVTRSRSSSRPRISRFPALVGDKKRKADVLLPRVAKSPQPRPEKTLAEIQMELIKAKGKENMRNKVRDLGKGKEKVLLPVKKENDDDLSLMSVEDSDFYDFDKDRIEKSFRKGQIWAIYDDDDGMPRYYGLIEEVISSNPFRMKMNWLELQINGDEALVPQGKSRFHISCGLFKLGRKVIIDSVNCFSHLLNCERAARELYRIYPKKGSVWAMYSEKSSGKEGRYYDIVVCLNNYNDIVGLSMAYLEKVKGYRTIFKRQAIGCHAIRCLEKDEMRLFSHQIPARKISETEGLDLPRDCWELDPASLPLNLLRICYD